MSESEKNAFLSHIHEDDAGIAKLKADLEKGGMKIRDSSINSDRPNNAKASNYIKEGILGPSIRWAGRLLVYISKKTKDSDWVNWEIEYAHKHNKPIIGVWAPNAMGCEPPQAFDEYGDVLVEYDMKKIIDAISRDYEKGVKKNFENPDGTPCGNRDISRHPCG